MKAPTMMLPVELSLEGIARARRDLDQTETIVAGTRASNSEGGEEVAARAGPSVGQPPDVVIVYEHARTVPDSHTPRLLELFARENPLTPEEIGIELGSGKPFNKAQGRAFVRNLSRMEGHLIKQGRITAPVLKKHFGGYEQEGAGRYGLSDEGRAALRAHLGG